jgi:hypothetical protein
MAAAVPFVKLRHDPTQAIIQSVHGLLGDLGRHAPVVGFGDPTAWVAPHVAETKALDEDRDLLVM